MHTIKNLTRQVVLLRLNSGAEINLGPEAQLENVAPSELRSNKTIEKLKRLGLIAVPETKTAGARAATTDAAPTDDDEAEDKDDTVEARRGTAEPRKRR
jgi:hypothetical protein